MPEPTLFHRAFLLLLSLLNLVALVSWGCNPTPPGTGSTPETRSRAGDTILVTNPSPGLPDTARLEEVWRLPQDSVTALARGPDGGILLARRGNGIHRVSPDGKSSREVAPGPFEIVTGLAAPADGGILVRDEGAGLVLKVSPHGGVEGRSPLPKGFPVYRHDALTLDTRGRGWLALGARFPSREEPVTYPRPVFVRLGPDLEPRDTLFVPDRFAEACPTLSQERFSSGRFEDFRVRYYPKVKWGFHPDGYLVAGCSADYTWEAIPPTGELLRVEKEWQALETPRDERLSFQTVWTAQMNLSGRYEEWGWIGSQLPRTRPAYHLLRPERAGRTWVWPVGPSMKSPTPATWPLAGLPDTLWVEPDRGTFDVFEADGTLRGHVAFPEALGYSPLRGGVHPLIVGDTLWVLVPGQEGGSEALVRLEVIWP